MTILFGDQIPLPKQICHPEEPTCLWQVKGGMNAEIDIDSIGFVFCSLGEVVIFLIFRVFVTPNQTVV
jgi:hypothetical protein